VIATIARALLVGLGCLGALWGAAAFAEAWRDSGVDHIAQRVVMGEPFRLDVLLEQVPMLDAIEAEAACRPEALRNASIVRLRIAESTLLGGDVSHLDERMDALRSAIVRSLSCSPSDSFLWLGLYWEQTVTSGFVPDDLKLLRMSYELGPNEGWIIVKRNPLALSVYSRLPPDLAELALGEFSKLFEPRLLPVAADILTGPGWPIRDLLLARIANKPQDERQAFSNLLRSRGFDIAVPGVTQKERPWL
jgi:hypothetical protein